MNSTGTITPYKTLKTLVIVEDQFTKHCKNYFKNIKKNCVDVE